MMLSARYLAPRLLAVAALVVLAGLAGGSWYVAGLLGGVVLVALLALRRSGRYLVTAEGAVLQRDERGRAIADRAARNGFVVLVLATGALSIAFHVAGRTAVPLGLLEGAMALGALVWLASDLWQRRG